MAIDFDDHNWKPADGNDPKFCEHCGQPIRKLNRHIMDRAKYDLLVEIARLNQQGHCWVKVQRDGRLIKEEERAFTIQCDAIHASRLYWFGLLQRKSARDGEYQVSKLGLAFLAGHATVPARIYCRRGVVEMQSIQHVKVQDIKHVVLDQTFWDRYAVTDQFASLST
jgi:hypothetical protein